MRVVLARDAAQQFLDRYLAQPLQVRGVRQVLAADGRGCLGQAQRQVPQLLRDRVRAVLISQPGPLPQVARRLRPGERRHVHRLTEHSERPVRGRDHDLGAARRGQERPQPVRVGRVVEHQQALPGPRLQIRPQPPRGLQRITLRVSDPQPLSHPLQAVQQHVPGLGVHPPDQPPPLAHPGPGVGGRDLRLAHPAQPRHRAHHRHPPPARGGGQPAHHDPRHERRRFPRDLPDHHLTRPNRHTGAVTARQRDSGPSEGSRTGRALIQGPADRDGHQEAASQEDD